MATAQERLNQYEELFRKSQSYDPNKFREDFTKAYDQETNYNKDLINERSEALSNLQRVTPTLKERYADSPIRNPLTHWRLIADQRQPYIERMSNAEGMLNARRYKFADILAKASGQYQSEAERASRAAENAWRLYQDQLAQEEAEKARRAQAAAAAQPSWLDYFTATQNQAQTHQENTSQQQKTPVVEVQNDNRNWKDKWGDSINKAAEALSWDNFRKRGALNTLVDYYNAAGWHTINPSFPISVAIAMRNKR